MRTFFRLFGDSLRIFFIHPLALVALQGSDILSEAATLWDPEHSSYMVVIILVVFPLIWLSTTFGLAATFAFLRGQGEGQKITVAMAYREAFAAIRRLFGAELVVSIAVLLGLLIVVPGIYFMAIYLFVPCLVIAHPGSSAFVYLDESKRLARKALWPLLLVSFGILVLSLGMNELEGQIDVATHRFLPGWLPESTTSAVGYILKQFVSMVMSATINSFICTYYFFLTEV